MAMKDTPPPKKGSTTRSRENGRSGLPDDSDVDEEQPDNSMRLSRRSVLLSAGTAACALAGGKFAVTDGVQAQPVESFGYGGLSVMRQSAQTVTVAESEPNDRRGNATAVDLGTTVTARLSPRDSDWYAIDLASEDRPVVEFERNAKDGISALVLFGPDGSLKNLRYVPDDQPLAFEPSIDVSGTHYVQVVDTEDSASDYSLRIVPESTDTETSTPTPTPDDSQTADEYGNQSYGEYGYGGVPAQ